MKPTLIKLYAALIAIFFITSCSTTQGWYDSDDPSNSEFSIVNTVLSVGAVAAIVMGAHELADNLGNSYAGDSYAWDYQPGNDTWVCRNKRNGQYANFSNCPSLSQYTVDNWP